MLTGLNKSSLNVPDALPSFTSQYMLYLCPPLLVSSLCPTFAEVALVDEVQVLRPVIHGNVALVVDI